jgi:N-acyl homoserine lactone hydrolase
MKPILLLALLACAPAIPRKAPPARAALPDKLPVLATCALVHLNTEEDLSNGARGWFRGTWKLSYTTFLVRHPQGVLLVDAAFGADTAADLDAAPWWFRWNFGGAREARPLAALLTEAGVKPEEVTRVLLTHAHWDHTGGLPQVSGAHVMTADDWILARKEPVADLGMPRHFAKAQVEKLTFSGTAYEGFDASQDVLGDGSIVAVPTPGHTRGATSYFVNSGDGHRWLFIGDAAWVKEGFAEPATKGRLASFVADFDREQAAETLGRLHAVYESRSAVLVTAHDERTWEGIPRCARP